ncbi:hypothetical protein CYMTET_30845 [Cymbomonas tetramitiformis]|uniref:Methyltransferase FkbM domain-containing protein n=1 Tax=Cymbomonas tetramitiformis TaxID=36881 RepID=A0AAE0FIA0_9CHLO|nr:hypothetical protein CYMTET_30845 [Cymbomonas tetramitiformis]
MEMITKHKCDVHGFDNTPAHMAWYKQSKKGVHKKFVHIEYLISASDEEVPMALPKGHVTSYSNLEAASSGFNSNSYVTLPARSLQSIMAELRHNRVDLIKMDVEGAEYRIISQWVSIFEANKEKAPIICQVLVEFHDRLFKDGRKRKWQFFADMKTLGFQVFDVHFDGSNPDGTYTLKVPSKRFWKYPSNKYIAL